MIPPERIGPKLDELKQFIDQAGRDFSKLELTALADHPHLNEKEVRVYQAAGVNVLYRLPISNDYQAVIREMRKFAQHVHCWLTVSDIGGGTIWIDATYIYP